jgi:hypothetical protein
VKVRALFPLAAAAGLWAPAASFAQPTSPAPVAAVNPNQQLADAVASKLRISGSAIGADVSVVTQDGTVHVSGSVTSIAQKDRVIAEVKGVTGVVLVRDNLLVGGQPIVQVQNQPMPLAPAAPVYAGPIVEPTPVGAPGQVSPELQAPPLPPYAWPTYAPHNNASRIAYPEAYPYNAFPFIGPYYPFPKVPLGWRKVSLEWEDGHWYYGRNSAPHDYWRVRFW